MTTDDAIRVLVVHSDPADLAVLASVVAAHTFHMRVLECADTLNAEVVRYQPDAVVLDVDHRELDTLQLCRALRRDPDVGRVPLILISSANGPEERARAFAAGCDDFLEKPMNRHVLVHRLRSLARLWRAAMATAKLLPALRNVGGEGRVQHACEQFGGYLERVLDMLDAFTALTTPNVSACTTEEAVAMLRRVRIHDPALLSAFEQWLQEQSQQVVP